MGEWREVPGYAGRYFVNAEGSVMTTTYGKPRLLAQAIDKRRGYHHVGLALHGAVRNYSVHRLIAQAFLGGDHPGLLVRHLDGNPSNNRVENLAWGTARDNQMDTLRHGRNRLAARTHCNRGHEFSPDNTKWNGGARVCRTCKRANERRARAEGRRP